MLSRSDFLFKTHLLSRVKEREEVDGFVSSFDKSEAVGICLRLSRQSCTLSSEKALSAFVSFVKK